MLRKLLVSLSVGGALIASFSVVGMFAVGVDFMPMLTILVLVVVVSVCELIPRDRQIQLNPPHAEKFYRGTGRSKGTVPQPPLCNSGIAVRLSRPEQRFD